MRPFMTLRIALRALWVHKGRSFLTSLGIIIGIGAVIAMVSAGDGVQQKLDESMESVGKNLIVIRPGARSHSGVVTDTTPLTRDDAALVRKQAAPFLDGRCRGRADPQARRFARRSWSTLLNGTVPDLQTVRAWKTTSGRFFTPEETAEAADVCVIGQTVRAKLFPDDPNPLGQTVRVDKLRLRVDRRVGRQGPQPGRQRPGRRDFHSDHDDAAQADRRRQRQHDPGGGPIRGRAGHGPEGGRGRHAPRPPGQGRLRGLRREHSSGDGGAGLRHNGRGSVWWR